MDKPEPAWGVYLLRCGDGSYYCGATSDRHRRLTEHQTGAGARYTRNRRPVELVYWEPATDRAAALVREAQIKKLSRIAKRALAEAAGDAAVEAGSSAMAEAAVDAATARK